MTSLVLNEVRHLQDINSLHIKTVDEAEHQALQLVLIQETCFLKPCARCELCKSIVHVLAGLCGKMILFRLYALLPSV